MTTRSTIATVAIVVMATILGARPIAAQYPEAAGIRRSVVAVETPSNRAASAAPLAVPPINGTRVAHGVLIGAGIGAVAGVIVAAAIPHSSHDEDAFGYIAVGAIGAFVGMVVGAAIGASR